MRIVGISGSLRQESFNSRLLANCAALLPDDCQYSSFDIAELPYFNEDLESEDLPTTVINLRETLGSADIVIIASPEYNTSIPGVLKNALDWASRPAFKSPLKEKSVAIISASPSGAGGAKVQAHLRQVLTATLSLVFTELEFALPAAYEKFDAQGELQDKTDRQHLALYLETLINWARAR